MRITKKKGILYPVLLLSVVMTLLMSYTVKPSIDALTHDDIQSKFFTLDTPTGLSSQVAYTIQKDKNGFIWVSTRNGIDCFDGATFHHYNLSNNKMRGLHEDLPISLYSDSDGDLWAFHQESQIYRLNRETSQFELVLSLPDLSIWGSLQALYRHKDCLYCGASDGITCYNLTTHQVVKRFCPDDNVHTLLSFHEDTLLYGSQRGIGYIDLNQNVGRHTHWIEAPVNCLYYNQPTHKLWVGGNHTGIYVIDSEHPDQKQYVLGSERYTVSQMSPYGADMLIGADGAGLWMAHTTPDGYVSSLELEADDSPAAPHHLESASVRSVLADQDHIWVALSTGGLVQLESTTDSDHSRPFDIVVLGKPISDNQVNLPFRSRNVDLQFATTDIYRQHDYHFYYRLNGLNPDWQPLDDSRHISFAQLPAGDYQLEVRAVGEASQAANLTIDIHAEREPWLRWYAIAGYVLVVVLLTIIVQNIIQNQRVNTPLPSLN